MNAVIDTHQRIRAEIQAHAAQQDAIRKANDLRMTAESGLGYRAQT